jgi:hypothetical protein
VSRLRIHITSDLGAVDLQQPVPTSDAEPRCSHGSNAKTVMLITAVRRHWTPRRLDLV